MRQWAPRILFSLNSFAAAMLALYLALGLGLVNPFWSAMTVYIVSQPQAGSVRSKALYRLLGTVVGASAAVMIVPVLYNAPELLSLALAGWVGLCLGISLLDRTPRSYVFMLSGYTAALIAFPGVSNPLGIFDTAVARTEEIALGIACATLIHSIVMPQGVATSLTAKIEGFMRDASRWMLDVLAGQHDPLSVDAHRLAADVTALHILSTHLPFDTSHFQDRSHEVAKLAERMAFLLPLAAAVGDRIDAHRRCGTPIPPASAALLDDVAAWVAEGSDARLDAADTLARRAVVLAPADSGRLDFAQLVLISLHARLADLIDAYRDCLALSRHIRTGEPLPDVLAPLINSARSHALHRDYGMALWSGVSATIAILTVCAFWIATGWPDGGTAAMLTSIFMCFFAAMDDPAKAIDSFARSWALSIPVAAFYVFAIMPMLHGFAMLVLALAPVLVGLGILVSMPRFTPHALPVAMGLAGSLGIQETFAPDFTQFANASLASLAGVLAASGVTRMVRSVGADFSARRIFRLARRDVAQSITARRPMPLASWSGRMVDRIGLLGARVIGLNDPDNLVIRALADMRVGINLLALRKLSDDGAGTGPIGRLLPWLARHFNGRGEVPDLLARIDAAIAETGEESSPASRRDTLIALVGLRRALFPGSVMLEPAP